MGRADWLDNGRVSDSFDEPNVCQMCRGHGAVECHCHGVGAEGENECERCGGSGALECAGCGGDGVVW